MKKPKKPPPVAGEFWTEYDWNFDNVPDDELAVCSLWEYARESAFIRGVWKRSVDAADYHFSSSDRMEYVGRDFMRMFNTLLRAAVLFQQGIYGFGHDTHYAGFVSPFPEPWLALSRKQRRVLIETAALDVRDRLEIPGFRRGTCADVIALSKMFQPRSQAEVFGGNGFIGINEYYHSGSKLRLLSPNLIGQTGTETLVVEIDWGELTNEELIEDFRTWLKENEPENVQRPDKRGHKLKDLRANLTRLAVMRLLSRFTPLNLVDTRQDKFPQVWETKQFSGPKWREITKWHDARREAGKLFRKLFPFVPANERPLSWERQPAAK